jgi:DtxR family Mn-dependent transcriptional regulator
LSSESVEEYLEAIYSINEQGKQAKNKELVKMLDVSPPSVTQMIQRLADDNLVEYKPYKGSVLTGKGMALAQKVVRKHRLLEFFLHKKLKLPREKAHNEACRMEHSLSDETASALCKALNISELNIDESIIPQCSLDVESCDQCEVARSIDSVQPLITQLTNLKPDEEGKIAYIRGGKRSTRRILDMGLTPGTFFRMVNSAPFNGPVEIEVRGTSLALGRKLASKVYVELDDQGQPWRRDHPHGPHHQKI